MKVNFERIKIEGFLSIGEADIELSNRNLVLVEGVNKSIGSLKSNGSGKSCIFEAIYWVLTGKTIRGSRDIINRYYGRKYTAVKLVMNVNDDEYVLSRFKEHPDHGNSLSIVKNNQNISGSTIKKSEQVLTNELPFLTEDLIGSVIILGQGMPSRFTSYNPSGRKEILEILSGNLGIVEAMKDKATVYRDKLSKKVAEINMKISNIEGATSVRKKDIEALLKNKEEAPDDLDKLKKEVEQLKEKKKDAEKEIDSYEQLLNSTSDSLSKTKVEKSSLDFELKKLDDKVTAMNTELKHFGDKKCPTCGQDLNDIWFVDKKKGELQDSIEKCEKEKKEVKRNLTLVFDKVRLMESKKEKLETAYKTYKEDLKSVDCLLLEKQSKLGLSRDFDAEIDKLKKEIDANDDLVYNLANKLNDYIKDESIADYLLREISRDFRGYLLKGIVDYINLVLSGYSKSLFGRESLELVLSDNKLFIEYEGRAYESLSGGERHRADLAMQFALRDMIMNDLGVAFNILVLDEVFDNLDENGVQSLIRFLTNNFGDVESVFVVTHHSSLDIPNDSKIIAVKDADNITEVRDEV